jgi:hypothetical protein
MLFLLDNWYDMWKEANLPLPLPNRRPDKVLDKKPYVDAISWRLALLDDLPG